MRPVLPAHTTSNSRASIDFARSEELKCDKPFQFFQERAQIGCEWTSHGVVSRTMQAPGYAPTAKAQSQPINCALRVASSKLPAVPRKRNASKCRANANFVLRRLGVALSRKLFRRMSGGFPPEKCSCLRCSKRRKPRQPFGCWGSDPVASGRRTGGE